MILANPGACADTETEEKRKLISVTQKEIADYVGVSRSTVAQVLTGVGRVHPETRTRVLEAARKFNYRPNAFAQAMVTGQTGNLAFWYSPSLDPHSMKIINGLDASVLPYRLTIRNVAGRQPVAGKPGELSPDEFPPTEWPVDGIFALSIGDIPAYLIRDNRVTTPFVSMVYDAFQYRPPEFVDTLLIRIAPACEQAMAYLVETRQRVALLCVDSMPDYGDVRYTAYMRAMNAAGRAPELILAPRRMKPYRFYACQAVLDYVRTHGCPDAIFCGNDEQATGAHLALHQLGYSVPGDVALIGNDGLEETEYHIPPLSTIAQPYEEIIDTAWEMMRKRLAEPNAPRQYAEVDAKLILRESSAARKNV